MNRSYSPLTSNQTSQNFDTVVFGDVAAPFANPRGVGPEPDAVGEEDSIASTVEVITLPKVFLGISTGTAKVEKYKFTPASRSYPARITIR